MSPAAPKLETVELFEDEHIVPRGSARSTWHVRTGRVWVRAREVPGARLQQLDPAPGCVWRCRIEVELAPGTELLLTQSVPLLAKKGPLEYLERGQAAGRRVRRTHHRVGSGGKLEPE